MTIQEWEAETPEDLPDYVSDSEDEVMQDAPYEVPQDAFEEDLADHDPSSPFLDVVELPKNHDDLLKELDITREKFDLLIEAFPALCDGGPNTTFNAAAEADWIKVLADDRRPANMTEVLKKQKVIARLRKAVPRVVVTDVDEHARVLDDNRTDDIPLPAMWRVLLLHPCVRRAHGSSLYFWVESKKWYQLVCNAGSPIFESIIYCLFPDPADHWRIWLMVNCERDDWLVLTQEDQIAMQRLREELDIAAHDLENIRPEWMVPEEDEVEVGPTPTEISIMTQCALGTSVFESDPFAWYHLQEQVHDNCPRGCKCATIFNGGEKYSGAWAEIEKLNKVPLSSLLQQIGMGSRDEGALLPGAWEGQSDLDDIRALPRDDRSLLMNIRLRFMEFHDAIAKGAEAIDHYRARYSTARMLDLIGVALDTAFMSVIMREIHLEMTEYKVNWAQVLELLSGRPYDHRARWSARHERLEEETMALIAARDGHLRRADAGPLPVVPVSAILASPAHVDRFNSNSHRRNSELPLSPEPSAHANVSAEDVDAAASLLLLAAGGAGDDHSSDDESPVSSPEGANVAGKRKRKRAEDMFDEDEAESKGQK